MPRRNGERDVTLFLASSTYTMDQGEVLARLVVHATTSKETLPIPDLSTIGNMTGDEALQTLQQLALMKLK